MCAATVSVFKNLIQFQTALVEKGFSVLQKTAILTFWTLVIATFSIVSSCNIIKLYTEIKYHTYSQQQLPLNSNFSLDQYI